MIQVFLKDRLIRQWFLVPFVLLVISLAVSTATAQDVDSPVTVTPYMVETDGARPISAEWITLSALENRSATVNVSRSITATTNVTRTLEVDGNATATTTLERNSAVSTDVGVELDVDVNKRIEDILVPFVRFQTTAKSPQAPVFVLFGEKQTNLVSPSTAQRFLRMVALLLNTSDVVLVGQRGTADGYPYLSCADEQLFPLDEPSIHEQLAVAQSQYAARCATFWQSSGVDTDGYNIVESAADVDELRRALGYDKITLIGVDLGVQIGFEVMRAYEATVDRAVFPLVVGPNQLMKLPSDLQAHLVKLDAQVKADPLLSVSIPDFLGLVDGVLTSLEGQSITVTVEDPSSGEPVTVTAGKYDLQFVTSMSQGGNEQKALPAHYYDMSRGDFTWLGEQVLSWRRVGKQDLAPALANCASGATETRRQRVANETPQTLTGDAVNGVRFDICDSLGNPDIGDVNRQAVISDVPVLFVSGSMDGHTPPSNADVLLSGLLNGQHLIVDGGTHDLLDDAFAEIAPILRDFLIGDPLTPLETTRVSIPYDLVPVTVVPLQIDNWRGEYFNNKTVQGDPTLVRDDAEINFNWGEGSPAPSINSDEFSARWTMSREVPAGTYRFSAWVDDGVRIWVDDVLILDRWFEGPARNYVVDVNVVRGLHTVRVEYFEAVDNAVAQVSIGRIDEYPDWKAEYFDNPEFAGAPVVVRNEPTIDYVWGDTPPVPGIPAGSYSVRWTGQFFFPQGAYRFDANVSGGPVRLWIDDLLLIDDTVEATARTASAETVFSSSGVHNVRVEYVYARGNGAISVSWQRATPAEQSPPTAVIVAPSFALIGAEATFDGSSSISSDGSALTSYAWDLGDGTSVSGPIVNHTYSAAGYYNVTLRVTDQYGVSDSATHQIRIGASPVTPTPLAPVAVIRAPDQGIVGQPITFDARASQSTNPIVSFDWQFGDGTSADAIIVEKTYGAAGVYNVSLTLTDDQGLQGRDSRFVQIYVAPPEATAAVTPTPTLLPVQPTPVPVTPIAVTPSPLPPGNSGVPPQASPTPGQPVSPLQTPGQPGVTPLPTTAAANAPGGTEGQPDSPLPSPVAEYQPPVPVIVAQIGDQVLRQEINENGIESVTVNVNDEITFDARGSLPGTAPIASYHWQFGNGQTSTLDVLPVTYFDVGDYEVVLAVHDANDVIVDTILNVFVKEPQQ